MEETMPAPNDIQLGRLGQIAMPASDLDHAVAFYRDQLGIPFLFRVPNLAFFDCAGVRLMLSAPEGTATDSHGSVLYFTVDDIQAAYTTLRARGVPFDDEPHIIANMDTYDLWMTFFRDPDGNLLAIMSEAPRE
jgi:catechol 2,3-dioxygenase-like lactoylglutathione lyase family enzyme